MKQEKTVIYSQAGCGKCIVTMREFDRKEIPYEVKRMDLDPEAREEAISMGAQGAPFVVTPTGHTFSGFQPAEIAKLVG